MPIDDTTIIMGNAKLGSNIYIGPYCILGFPSTEMIDPQHLPQDETGRPVSRGVEIGNNTSLLSHVVIGDGTILGNDIWCDHHSYIGSDTLIMSNTYIMYGARIYNRARIEESCWIGGFVCNDALVERGAIVMGQLIHRFVNADKNTPESSPVVRRNAFIGMNSQIIGGIEVGENAYIGAGSVLTHSALPGRLYMGAPAKDVGPAPKPFDKD